MTKKSHEPLIQMSKRESISPILAYPIRIASLVLGLIVAGIVVFLIVKLNPLNVYGSMFNGAFGTTRKIWSLLRDTMILSCIGIGLGIAFKMRFWNIGGEGQMLMGGVATAFFMITMPNLSKPLLFLCMITSAIIMGGIWGLIPGIFKAKWSANETLFTLMMNYIAIQFTSYCVSKWENPKGSNTVGIINSRSKAGWIGNMLSPGYNKDYMWIVIIVIIIAIVAYIYIKNTKQGFEISVVGDSYNTATYAGIRVPRVYIRTMAISGAICGFAGFLAVTGASHTISTTTAGGRGFSAIIVAWLSKMNPFVMIVVSILITFLDKGAVQIASDFGLNEYMSQIITGIILFFLLGCEFFINYKIKLRGRNR